MYCLMKSLKNIQLMLEGKIILRQPATKNRNSNVLNSHHLTETFSSSFSYPWFFPSRGCDNRRRSYYCQVFCQIVDRDRKCFSSSFFQFLKWSLYCVQRLMKTLMLGRPFGSEKKAKLLYHKYILLNTFYIHR